MDITELRDRLRRVRAARERAEETAAEASAIEQQIQAQIAAASSQRRHRRDLRALLLLPGIAAVKGAMATGHKIAAPGGVIVLTGGAAGAIALLPHTGPTPPPPATVSVSAPPHHRATPHPHRSLADMPAAPRRGRRRGTTLRVRSTTPRPAEPLVSIPATPAHTPAAQLTTTCIKVTAQPIATIRILCGR